MIAVFGGLAAFGVFGGFSGIGRSGASDPYEAIPKASFIAATIDFAELRRSPLFEVAVGKDTSASDPMRRALGVGALQEACGFDPVSRIQKVAISVPEEGERGEFGVVARVEVSRDELERCTKALAEKRGGRAETHDVGTFVVLEDHSISGAGSRLAYGKGGLLVVGKGSWFDAMLGAADHLKPGIRDAQQHVALRKSLTSKDSFRAPTVVVTAILPRALRERLKGEMGAELGGADLSNAAMAGVLGVSAVGVAIAAGSSNVDAAVELVCDSPDACEAVKKLVDKKRAEWSSDLGLRMIGFGPLFDSFDVKLDGARLRATVSAQGDALAATLDRVLKLRARQNAATAPGPRRLPPQKAADETIPSRADAGR
jgi:hypothetical protein